MMNNNLLFRYDQELLALRTRHEQEVTRLTAEREAREARKQQVIELTLGM